MASKKTRQSVNRRDRRKAKASGWNRSGKSNPKLVGHGGSGDRQNSINNPNYSPPKKKGKKPSKKKLKRMALKAERQKKRIEDMKRYYRLVDEEEKKPR